MKSLGLRRNPHVMKFDVGEWKLEPGERKQRGPSYIGGIWVAQNISGCRKLRKYMMDKYGRGRFSKVIGRN